MKSKNSGPIIYMIRHGEKPPKINDEDQPGLSIAGIDRSQGLVQVFGRDSKYDIGYIIAQAIKVDKSGQESRTRPLLTVKPLAASLGSNVTLDDSVDRDDPKGVHHKVKQFKGPGNILICWEHQRLAEIAEAIGVPSVEPYPGDRFDLIWTLLPPYDKIDSITSEHCPGLDDKYASEP